MGDDLIDTIAVNGRVVARGMRLVCILQDGPDGGPADAPPRAKYVGSVEKVTLEQSGPVRVVVRIEGRHRAVDGSRTISPLSSGYTFTRARTRCVSCTRSSTTAARTAISSAASGLSVRVPLREEVQNRHVRFSGEGSGLWAEPVQPMVGRQGRYVSYPGDARGRPEAARCLSRPD